MLVLHDAQLRHKIDFHDDVIAGLSASPKTLPCRWLYDERGSDLFEAVARLDDYYPTRVETEIVRRNANAIGEFAGPGATLIEYGAGAGLKIC